MDPTPRAPVKVTVKAKGPGKKRFTVVVKAWPTPGQPDLADRVRWAVADAIAHALDR